MKRISIIEAPSSAGAYAPGQEKAPRALLEAGLAEKLRQRGWKVDLVSDIDVYRWRPDRNRPKAMNVDAVLATAKRVAQHVQSAALDQSFVLVLGGDCTVGIGTVAGLSALQRSLGLVYMDYDCDLMTPQTTTDGALDWMGVGHMMNLPGCMPALTGLAGTKPLISGGSLLFFGAGNVTATENAIIETEGIAVIGAGDVARAPVTAAEEAARWMKQFPTVAVHFDVDLVDFEDFPLAENSRRKEALSFESAMTSLCRILECERVAALTVTEVNPDHDPGGNIEDFVSRLVDAIGARWETA